MRFTDGLWESRNGYKLHRAHSLWEWRAEDKQVHFMVPCTEIRSLRDTISGPVLHFTITAPRKDILAVKVYHFTGKKERGPVFDLDVSYMDTQVCETEQEILITNGKMKAVVSKTGDFGIAFYYDGRFLTKCGEKVRPMSQTQNMRRINCVIITEETGETAGTKIISGKC